MTKIGGGPG